MLFGLFYIIWWFVTGGECCNFRLFGLFAVILIDLSLLIFFSKTKMRMDTLANPYFLNLYIPTNFFFFFKFEGGHWSHTGSTSAPHGHHTNQILWLKRKVPSMAKPA